MWQAHWVAVYLSFILHENVKPKLNLSRGAYKSDCLLRGWHFNQGGNFTFFFFTNSYWKFYKLIIQTLKFWIQYDYNRYFVDYRYSIYLILKLKFISQNYVYVLVKLSWNDPQIQVSVRSPWCTYVSWHVLFGKKLVPLNFELWSVHAFSYYYWDWNRFATCEYFSRDTEIEPFCLLTNTINVYE